MANTRQAKKRVRHAARAADVNKKRLSRIRNAVKRVEAALKTGDKKAAAAALQTAKPEIFRGVSKGVLHHNTAARKVARLEHRLNVLAK
ncbi:MAG TPA: 30S ribosomal protein S20 [Sphingomonadales bacterium]|nr:30S ribosomal protein S20 [Sphingomonadales bacterium]